MKLWKHFIVKCKKNYFVSYFKSNQTFKLVRHLWRNIRTIPTEIVGKVVSFPLENFSFLQLFALASTFRSLSFILLPNPSWFLPSNKKKSKNFIAQPLCGSSQLILLKTNKRTLAEQDFRGGRLNCQTTQRNKPRRMFSNFIKIYELISHFIKH